MAKLKLMIMIPVGICVVLAGILYALQPDRKGTAAVVSTETEYSVEQSETSRVTETRETTSSGRICVYVCGQVIRPGVCYLDCGSRIYEAIAAAGGLTEQAEAAAVNQAQVLTDGQMVYIPAVGGESIPSGGVEATTAKININTAGAEALMTLPGVGESKAVAIIAYREKQGGFSDISDIMNVAGIKESSYDKIKDFICVK